MTSTERSTRHRQRQDEEMGLLRQALLEAIDLLNERGASLRQRYEALINRAESSKPPSKR